MPLAVDFQGGVSSAWSNVITFVPKLAAALANSLRRITSSNPPWHRLPPPHRRRPRRHGVLGAWARRPATAAPRSACCATFLLTQLQR